MFQYIPGKEHDLLLLQWWEKLFKSGELQTTYGSGAESLGTFYELFRAPKLALMDADEEGIFFCMSLEPFMSGAAATLWIRDDKRRSIDLLKTLRLCYEKALDHFPVLIGVTRQQRLLEEHVKWGYTVLGEIPALMDKQPTWVVYLTKAGYEAAQGKRKRKAG